MKTKSTDIVCAVLFTGFMAVVVFILLTVLRLCFIVEEKIWSTVIGWLTGK